MTLQSLLCVLSEKSFVFMTQTSSIYINLSDAVLFLIASIFCVYILYLSSRAQRWPHARSSGSVKTFCKFSFIWGLLNLSCFKNLYLFIFSELEDLV